MPIFFFNDPATAEIYTLSLHDALPISRSGRRGRPREGRSNTDDALRPRTSWSDGTTWNGGDRKSTRLNSSHSSISYAVFCLKKKKPAARRLPTISDEWKRVATNKTATS